jgi:hypothetical protein
VSGYTYTYDLRPDEQGFADLPAELQALGREINRVARETGDDRADLLAAAGNVPDDAKDVLARVWGGEQ